MSRRLFALILSLGAWSFGPAASAQSAVVPTGTSKPNIADSWVVGPVLKMVGEFEQSVKQHPLIPMGTPDPYRPGTPLR